MMSEKNNSYDGEKIISTDYNSNTQLQGQTREARDEMFSLLNTIDKTIYGCIVGYVLGCATGVVGAVWGGYEIGSAINDYLSISSIVGRGVLDLIVISIIANHVIDLGKNTGTGTGIIIGSLVARVQNARIKK